MFSPKKILQLDFATVEIHENYFVSTVKQNSMVTLEVLEQLVQISEEYFPDKKFGYISNRANRYNVDPTGYVKTSFLPRFEGMTVVCHSELQKKTALFEKKFYKKPFEVFDDLEKAHLWIRELLQEKNKPQKTLELDFATLEFYENYLISTIKDEVVFSNKHLKKILPLIDEYYQDKSIGYIANRKNSYNTDPTVYLQASKHKNILGMAVIYRTEAQKENALFEKRFYKKAFEVFDNLESAKSWMEKLVNKKTGL